MDGSADEQAPGAAAHGPVLRNIDETARFFGVARPTVRSWIRDGCPVEERGGPGVGYQLDLIKVAAWRRAKQDQEAAEQERKAEEDQQLALELLGDDMLQHGDAQAGFSKAEEAALLKREYEKIKLAQLRRELVRADELKLEMTKGLSTLRDRLRSLPDGLGREFGLPDEVVERMVDGVDEALDDIIDEIERLTDDAAAPTSAAA